MMNDGLEMIVKSGHDLSKFSNTEEIDISVNGLMQKPDDLHSLFTSPIRA